MTKQPCVYILASKKNGTLYIGVTSNLIQRIWQHKNNQEEGFTKKHNVHTLTYYEQHETMESAITREKLMKKWKREANRKTQSTLGRFMARNSMKQMRTFKNILPAGSSFLHIPNPSFLHVPGRNPCIKSWTPARNTRG